MFGARASKRSAKKNRNPNSDLRTTAYYLPSLAKLKADTQNPAHPTPLGADQHFRTASNDNRRPSPFYTRQSQCLVPLGWPRSEWEQWLFSQGPASRGM